MTTFPLRGKWGDFVNYRAVEGLFFVLNKKIIEFHLVIEVCIIVQRNINKDNST